jgi:tRNA nucleotidyltransferase/poly(A) polymerase
MQSYLTHPLFKTLSACADKLGMECYVIGGFVRDIFLNRASNDIDVVVVGSGIAMAEEVKKTLGKQANLAVFKNLEQHKLSTKIQR